MDEDEQLTVKVPLEEYEIMVKAVEVLADIRRGDKIIVDKAKYEELLKVSKQVDTMLGKLDDAAEAREAAEAPARRPVPPGMII